VAELYRCKVDSVRHDRTDGVHEIRVDAPEGSAGEEPVQSELQRERSPRDANAHPALHELPEIGSEMDRDDNESHPFAASADKLGARTLHPAVVVNVVRDEGHDREEFGRATGSKKLG
jgi:hypothetical protein